MNNVFIISSLVVILVGGCVIDDSVEGDNALLGSPTQEVTGSADILYGVAPTSGQLIAINTHTGAGAIVGSLGIDISQAGGTTDCNGDVWMFSRPSNDASAGILYTVDLGTGAATVQQTYDLSGLPGGVGIEFGPDGETLYWRAGNFLGILEPDGSVTTVNANLAGSGVSMARSKEGDFYAEQDGHLVRLGLDGSVVVDIGPTQSGISSLSFSDGRLLAHAGSRLYEIDETSGATTFIGDIGHSTPGTAFAIAQGCAPECDNAAAEDLWPPNHKMRSVTIAGVLDPDGDDVTITVDSIFQDEPVDARGNGDGNTAPDATIGTEPAVRAERAGGADGRVYHLGFTATDTDGNSCEGTVTVCVPHDQGNGSECVDQGPLYDSTVAP